MNSIPVKPCRAIISHGSIREAIDFANSHPLQSQAKADSDLLAGAKLEEAFWTATEFVFRFSNGKNLHVYLQNGYVHWRVCAELPVVANRLTIGAEAVVFRWPGEVGDHPMDCSDMIKRRINSEFRKLFVNDLGLLVYLKNVLILYISVVERTDNGAQILHVSEGE